MRISSGDCFLFFVDIVEQSGTVVVEISCCDCGRHGGGGSGENTRYTKIRLFYRAALVEVRLDLVGEGAQSGTQDDPGVRSTIPFRTNRLNGLFDLGKQSQHIVPFSKVGLGSAPPGLNWSASCHARAMLAAGLIGVFIASGATFAAEVGGCQAECGAGSGMAAAALGLLLLLGTVIWERLEDRDKDGDLLDEF